MVGGFLLGNLLRREGGGRLALYSRAAMRPSPSPGGSCWRPYPTHTQPDLIFFNRTCLLSVIGFRVLTWEGGPAEREGGYLETRAAYRSECV